MKMKLFLVIAGLTGVCFLIGLYAGGWVWLRLCADPLSSPGLMTLLDQGELSLTDKSKMLLPWAWCVTAAITFLPTGVTLFAFAGMGEGRQRHLHGNACFANRRELRKIWYTGPEQ